MNHLSGSKFMRSWTMGYMRVALDGFSKYSPRPFVILQDPRFGEHYDPYTIDKEHCCGWMVLDKELAIIQTHLNEKMGLTWNSLIRNGYNLEEDCLALITAIKFQNGIILWHYAKNPSRELRFFFRELKKDLARC